MKRSNTQAVLNHANLAVYEQRLSYHEAGHAAAIHLNNRLKKLPPVFYKIQLDYLESDPANRHMAVKSDPYACIGRINGGRLIQSLPFKGNELNLKPAENTDAIMCIGSDLI